MSTHNSGNTILCIFVGKEASEHFASRMILKRHVTDRVYYLSLMADAEPNNPCPVLSLPPLGADTVENQLRAVRPKLVQLMQSARKVVFVSCLGDNTADATSLLVKWCVQARVPFRVIFTMPLRVFGNRSILLANAALASLERAEQGAGLYPSLLNHVIDVERIGHEILREPARSTIADLWNRAADEAVFLLHRICSEE